MKQKYVMTLKVISPIYIGSGEIYSRCDYVSIPEEKKVYVLDKSKWINFLVKRKLYENFIREINKEGTGLDIYKWLNANNRIIREKNMPAFVKSLSEAVFDISHITGFRNHRINGFIKNAAREPYIPGSSIKGALAGAILARCIENSGKQAEYLRNLIDLSTERNKENIGNKAKRLNEKIYSDIFNYKIDNEIIKGMSGISISDSEPLKKENLKLYKKKDLIVANNRIVQNKSDRPIFRECLDAGAETRFTITMDYDKLKKEMGICGLNNIMDALAIRFEKIYGKDGAIMRYKESASYIPRECTGKGIMQIGGGTGFHSKTIVSSIASDNTEANEITAKLLDKLFRGKRHSEDRPISPRALKVVTVKNEDVFMGFCKIKEIEEC